MDVKCERCNTEYEFDDALVSGRGTTVKCTNCGHKFKIRRKDGDYSEDFWNVTTGDGRTLVFTSLRELQRAIQGYLVERNDRLSRGGLPPKPIGQIPELAPFFEQREAAKRNLQSARAGKTHDGLGPPPPPVATQVGVAPPPNRPRQATKPEFPAPPADGTGKTTLIGTGPLTDQEAFPVQVSAPAPTREVEPTLRSETGAVEPASPPAPPPPPTQVSAPPPVPRPAASPTTSAAPQRPSAAPPTPPPLPKRESSASDGARAAAENRPAAHTVPLQRPTPPPVPSAKPTPPPPPAVSTPPPLPRRASDPGTDGAAREAPRERDAASAPADTSDASSASNASTPLPAPARPIRSLRAELEEDRVRDRASSEPDGLPPRRRSVGGFIVATVVVGCLLMLGAVAAQKNLGSMFGAKPPAPTPTVDPRVEGFLAAGEKALADGNLELAKESFDKASALSEKDPHVLLGLARLAAIRADLMWLKSRLLPPDAADDHRLTRDSLNELAATARKVADDALAVAPDEPRALRAKIDALRISGDLEGARALVGKISASSAQPETAYVLAALDLAEAEPLWPTVIERLKTASSAETGPGRARAALVFALARSGDVAGARAEIDRLAALTRPHPLLPLLRSFAERAPSASSADAGAPAASAEKDAGRPAAAAHAGGGGGAVEGGGGGGGGGGGALSGDPRQLVSLGERARAKGDYERARALYSAALEKNPHDSEALAGLAAIAYAQHDLAGARASYKRVLAVNPNYMPALVGLADVEWDSGDKATAVKMYKDIVDRYPEGAYPGRVKQRAEGGG